jgi:hypothetical protein
VLFLGLLKNTKKRLDRVLQIYYIATSYKPKCRWRGHRAAGCVLFFDFSAETGGENEKREIHFFGADFNPFLGRMFQ